ncbi:MFS transporter [Conexibacter sp. SYSU D00693]|uniref:MFS transporter n=1 Tax=Conexibacter sp. SYSU D00693 TaxID=2812560 RepID=UPI00196B621D|nr:MFS transporter [Conexibacter sp. SYSU D00693]
MAGARPRTLLLAAAAALALADTSIVTLALPALLNELDATVQGVAGVLAIYTFVLVPAVLGAERVQRRAGPAVVGAAGGALFAAASALCGAVDSLTPLLVLRGVQAVGGAAVLVAAFAVLAGDDERRGRQLWLGAAVLAAAVGPALGGLLTELFSWRSIFLFQAPVAAAAALACWSGRSALHEHHAASGAAPAAAKPPVQAAPALALLLVSAALSAVLFLLILLLVAGWAEAPLEAAAIVTVLPAAAVVGARLGGPARTRAAAGCALVGGGVLALAFVPEANLLWTVPPQVAAGLGMGLSLTALGGDLLPERDAGDAAKLLALRHAGIALAVFGLAFPVQHDLDDATTTARERGVAIVLDARIDPLEKVRLAPELLSGVDAEAPRGALRDALAEQEAQLDGDEAERAEFRRVAQRADDTLVAAVGEAFRTAFLVTGALALLAALVLLPVGGTAVGLAAVVALVLPAGYALAHDRRAPEPVRLQNPCEERELPSSGGLGGFLQDRALAYLDTTACRNGSTREELVLALADADDARRYEERHGVNPRSIGGLLEGLLGG